MKKIGIIGAGFTGTMTAVQLIDKATTPIEIVLIDKQENMHKGIAYNPYSENHLLNVKAAEMSAFPDQPSHFLEWIMAQSEYINHDIHIVSKAFMPRTLYGRYLIDVWNESVQQAAKKQIAITKTNAYVVDLASKNQSIEIQLSNGNSLNVHECIIATGNHLPANPRIAAKSIYLGDQYFRNPWTIDAVMNADTRWPVLIMGNGLTMADTVLALLEQGFTGDIITLSPNGFNLLPHTDNPPSTVSQATIPMNEAMTLYDWVRQVNGYKKQLLQSGGTIHTIVESLRPHVQAIWKSLSTIDKQQFMKRLRHIWNAVRHRIPAAVYNTIQQLIDEQRLTCLTGRITDLKQTGDCIEVLYQEKHDHRTHEIQVSRIINCTGPETDLSKLDHHFLHQGVTTRQLMQDPLKLGLAADTNTFQVLRADSTPHVNLYTIGVNLRGMLWESTAVCELRLQAAKLAEIILGKEYPDSLANQVDPASQFLLAGTR